MKTMAPNQLSEKLDLISDAELNVDFDGMEVWSKLEERLDGKKRITYWWVVAACILMLTLFAPISVLKETSTQSIELSEVADLKVDQLASAEKKEVKEVIEDNFWIK